MIATYNTPTYQPLHMTSELVWQLYQMTKLKTCKQISIRSFSGSVKIRYLTRKIFNYLSMERTRKLHHILKYMMETRLSITWMRYIKKPWMTKNVITFGGHNKGTVDFIKTMTGWVLRTFKQMRQDQWWYYLKHLFSPDWKTAECWHHYTGVEKFQFENTGQQGSKSTLGNLFPPKLNVCNWSIPRSWRKIYR